MSTADLSCPVCGAELSLAVLLADADAQAAFARLAQASLPLGARVMSYLTLHTPPKTRLTLAKQIKLVLQLLPDIERQAITAKGRDWAVPHSAWAQGIDQMLAARDAGRLELPLRGHGYLYTVLVGQADKHEAARERATEQERRARPHAAGVQGTASPATQAGATSAAQALGGKDPVLLALEQHARAATPMPAHVREQLQQTLKKGN